MLFDALPLRHFRIEASSNRPIRKVRLRVVSTSPDGFSLALSDNWAASKRSRPDRPGLGKNSKKSWLLSNQTEALRDRKLTSLCRFGTPNASLWPWKVWPFRRPNIRKLGPGRSASVWGLGNFRPRELSNSKKHRILRDLF